MVRLTVVIPFLFLVACVCTYPSKTPDNEELYDDRNNINNQSLRLRRQSYNNYFNGTGNTGQILNNAINSHFGDNYYGNNGTSKPTHIVNINGGVANGGASYGSGNGGHGGFNTFYGDKHQKMHVESGHGGEGGKGGGQITTNEVVITKNNNNPENRRETNNAISSSNGPINMSIGKPASVARKPVTEGGSEAGAMSINNSNGGDNGHICTLEVLRRRTLGTLGTLGTHQVESQVDYIP